jgi:hypothetical protein
MLTGVSKKMAAEFFGNVDAVLAGVAVDATVGAAGRTGGAGAAVAGSGGRPDGSIAPVPSGRPAEGQVFTAPSTPSSAAGGGPGFLVGVAVGAAAALAGAVVGGWLAGRQRG